MTTVELTSHLETDLVFGRGETPVFRLVFTGVTPAEMADWDITGPIRRAPALEPFAGFNVTVDDTAVTFGLDTDVTDDLPDASYYAVRLARGADIVRTPLGGRLLLRVKPCR